MERKGIIKNSLFLYFRMFLVMGVSLYTSRIILAVLGVENFGIYSLIGGIVSLFAFLNAAMSSASQRFLSIAIGKDDFQSIKETFNVSLIIHIGIALIILFFAETVGLWFVNYKLDIPSNRIFSANIVFQFSVLISIISITQVPFNALIIAKERFRIFAFISIIEVVLKLAVAYLLYYVMYDKLIVYSLLLVIVSLVISTVYKVYCLRNFKESFFELVREKSLYHEMIAYSGWSLFGNIASVAKGQGINVLINIFFGTVLNASYGIMMQVQSALSSFVQSFQGAINPRIYKIYASGNMKDMQILVFQGAKYSFFLTLLVSFPVIYNVDFILFFWLKNPPNYTSQFICLTLINLMIESISQPLITSSLATGRIKWYQIIVGSTLFLNLPISYCLFYYTQNALMFLYTAIVLSIVTLLFRLAFLKSMISLDLKLFFKESTLPILIVSVSSFLMYCFLENYLGFSLNILSFVISSIFMVIILILLIFIFGMSHRDRLGLMNFLKSRMNK